MADFSSNPRYAEAINGLHAVYQESVEHDPSSAESLQSVSEQQSPVTDIPAEAVTSEPIQLPDSAEQLTTELELARQRGTNVIHMRSAVLPSGDHRRAA